MTGLPGNPMTEIFGLLLGHGQLRLVGDGDADEGCFCLHPASLSYSNVTSDQTNQDYETPGLMLDDLGDRDFGGSRPGRCHDDRPAWNPVVNASGFYSGFGAI